MKRNDPDLGETAGKLGLRELEIFVTFALTEHMGRAADELGMSVPSIQRTVRALELDLGVPLVERDGRRVRLLRAGHVLAEHGARIMRSRADAVAAARAASGRKRTTLRLGHIFSLGYVVVPEYVARLVNREPETFVQLRQGATDVLTSAVLAGEIDAAFVAGFPQQPDLHAVHVFDESLLVTLPADDPLAGRDQVELAAFRERDFITLAEGSSNRSGLLKACARAGFRPRIVMEADDLGTLEGAVAVGLGIAVVPQCMSGNPGPKVTRVPIVEDVPNLHPVSFIYPRTTHRNDAVAALLSVISEN